MSVEKIQRIARKYALQNAIQFNGRADSKAVVGKVVAALKKDGLSPRDIVPVVNAVVEQVNLISLDEQCAELREVAPDLLVKGKKERDFSLPDLPFATKGEVVTRFPPEPNGYLHIGHAKAAIIDSGYARLYDGRFILRFDDTNPENAEFEFYDAQREDLRWLGVEWDDEYNTSDHLETHYRLAEKLIQQGDAYVCKCPPEVVKEGRFLGKSCSCRDVVGGVGLDLWRELRDGGESKGGILRLRGEMSSVNTAMRDPTLFRVIDKDHPIQGDRYRVWPTYDFAGAVEDSISGVTHPFRTKEYELRDPVYFRILSLLNLRRPYLMEFSRLSITGMPVSKRKIKPLIEKGLVSGYDDVRLPTLRGLKKRGIVPETIKQFVLSQGISKVESSVDFSIVEAFNRKILDPKAKRYFFVSDPVKLVIEDAPEKKVKIPLHPSVDMGMRMIKTKSEFYVQKDDIIKMRVGDVFRLKSLYNVHISKKDREIVGRFGGEDLIAGTAKIQWTTDDYIKIKVFVPGPVFVNNKYNPQSLVELNGYAEKAVSDLHSGDIVQFERVGFVRIEKKDNDIIGFFTHK